MRFYLTFAFLGFKVVKKWTVNLFKGSEDFGFLNFIWLIEKYKPALSKSDSSWDNSYCMRLVIVSLAGNIGKLNLKIIILKKWKTLLEISSFFTCVPKTTIIWGTIPPLQPAKSKFWKKWKKHLEMASFYTCIPKITSIWCMLPAIWSASFCASFCLFTPILPQKLKLKKIYKKAWRYYLFTCVS